MRYMGIDYGKKRIGIALSDPEGKIAFPKKILENRENVIGEIEKIVKDEGVGAIVIGKSLQLSGSENLLQREIDSFLEKLKSILGREVEFYEQDERMSSLAVRSLFYGKGNIANEHWTEKKNKKKREAIDDSAAAIILQRFLDRKK